MKIGKWQLNIWSWGHKWTLGFSLERWNNGEEWRLYFLIWEFNLALVDNEV